MGACVCDMPSQRRLLMRFRAATSSCLLSLQPFVKVGTLSGHAYSTVLQGVSGSAASVHGAGRACRDMAPCRRDLDRLRQGCWVRSRWPLCLRSPFDIWKWIRWTQALVSVLTGSKSTLWSWSHYHCHYHRQLGIVEEMLNAICKSASRRKQPHQQCPKYRRLCACVLVQY